ncbi:O-antigen ligase family protein [Microcoleus sp. ZQ-A2]|nr:O-antigen ligase family protein [Microcoleus sp. FACHB-1]
MKTRSFKHFVEKKLEIWLIGFLLLFFLGLDLPAPLPSAINAASYAILFPLIIWRWKRFSYVATRDIFLLLLIAITMVSVLWSASPEITSTETKAVLRTTLLGVYFATRFSIKEQMQLLAGFLGIAAVLSFVFGIGMPSYGVHQGGEFVGSWKGVFLFKNLFASIMTLAAMLFLLFSLNSRKKRCLAWMMFGLSVLLLILSRGKTSYSVLFILLGLLPLHKAVKQKYKLRSFLLVTSFLFISSVIFLVLNNLEFILVDLLGKNMEFNGRLPIWTLMVDKVSERPWLGYGYSGFWTSDEAMVILTNTWADTAAEAGVRFNAHNGYLDLVLQLGFSGLFLYLLSFLTCLIRTINLLMSTKTVESFWILQLLVALFLLNFADSVGILSTNGLWSLYISCCLSTAVEQTRLRRNRLLSSAEIAA